MSLNVVLKFKHKILLLLPLLLFKISVLGQYSKSITVVLLNVDTVEFDADMFSLGYTTPIQNIRLKKNKTQSRSRFTFILVEMNT